MDVKQEDSDLEQNLKMKVDERLSVQQKSEMEAQEDTTVQLKSSLVFQVELIRELTWDIVVQEDSLLFADSANSQVCWYSSVESLDLIKICVFCLDDWREFFLKQSCEWMNLSCKVILGCLRCAEESRLDASEENST